MDTILLADLPFVDFNLGDHLTGLADGNPHHDNPFVMDSHEAKGFKQPSIPSLGDFLAPQQQKLVKKQATLHKKKCRETKFSEMKTHFPAFPAEE